MKGIEKILYDSTRFLHGVEDRLRIATPFIFTYKIGSVLFAEMLYGNPKSVISDLQETYKSYEVDFEINLNNKSVSDCFYKTRSEIILKFDSKGFYKALFEGDEFALAIVEITETKMKSIEMMSFTKKIQKQLELQF